MPLATKLGKVMTYCKGLPLIHSQCLVRSNDKLKVLIYTNTMSEATKHLG